MVHVASEATALVCLQQGHHSEREWNEMERNILEWCGKIREKQH